MPTVSIVRRACLLSAVAIASPALAATDDAADRDYLPSDIVVTADRGGYRSDDGSTATKTPTPLINVPQAVTVITKDQLEDQNITQLNNALRFVPGISLETGEGHRDEVFIRGQETTADFYLDGLRDDGEYYRPLYNIERIEVLKGANALIFGRGAGGGAINRVSKIADPDRMTFGSLSASADSFGAFAVSGDVSTPLADDAAIRMSGTYERFDSHRDFYDGRFFGFTPTVTLDPGEDTRVILSYTYDDDARVVDRGVPSLGGLPLTGFDETFFGDPDYNFSDVEVHIARASVEHRFSSALSANASVQFADYDKFYANLVPGGTTATTVSISGYESGTDRQNFVGQTNFVGTFDTGPIAHTLLIGAEFTTSDTDAVRDQARFGTGRASSVAVPLAQVIAPPAFVLVPQRASTSDLETISFYAQEQADFGIVQLIAGVRYDEFDLATVDLISGFAGARKDSRWSPRLGAVVKPMQSLSIYASWAESFLPQSGNQFTVLNPTSVTLEPETFENLELGLKWAMQPELLLTAAIFRLTRDNTAAPDPRNPGFVVLAGESEVEGLEIGLVGKVLPALNVSLGYSYLDGEITQTTSSAAAGTVLQQVPKHHITAWARYDVTERLGLGAGVIHRSDQFASLSNNVVLPSFTRVDAAVFFEASERLSLQLNVENLFDENYYPSAHGDNNIQPGEPFNVSLGARLSF